MKRVGIALCAALVAVAAGCGPSPHHVASSKTSPRGALDSGSPGAPAATGLAPATGTSGSATSVPVSDPSVPTTATTLAGTGGGGGGGATGPIPKVITVAYVDAVFAQLDALQGDALRSTIAVGHLSTSAVRDLYAIMTPKLAWSAIRAYQVSASEEFPYTRRPPGNLSTIVLSLLKVSRNCVVAKVILNYSEIETRHLPQPTVQYLGIRDRSILNAASGDPTPWAVFLSRSSLGAPGRLC